MMMLYRFGIRPAASVDEWAMCLKVEDRGEEYIIEYFHDKKNRWSEPLIHKNDSADATIEEEELIKVKELLRKEKRVVKEWLKEDKKRYIDFLELNDDAEIVDFSLTRNDTYTASFRGKEMKMNIYFSEEVKEFPLYSLHYQDFANFSSDFIEKKYPGLIKKIMEKHPKRLRILLAAEKTPS